jgi:hypothetical protein
VGGVTRLVALALAAALAVPALAAAAAPKPPSGKYRIDYNGTGSMRVKDKVLTALSVVPKDQPAACGTGTIKLKSTHKLTTATRAGYTNWIVGKNTPKTSSGYSLVKGTFAFGGKTVAGKIKVLWFDDNLKTGDGEIVVGDCDLHFSFQK